MGFFNKKQHSKNTYESYDLKSIADTYTEEWPDNNDNYFCWKPDSILPAPKHVVKQAMKLFYAKWPEPINDSIHSAFSMEVEDLALHLPQKDYEAITEFRSLCITDGKSKTCSNLPSINDPLNFLHPASPDFRLLGSFEHNIIQIRKELQPSNIKFQKIGITDNELNNIREIVLRSIVELAALSYEWGFYLLSIGRYKPGGSLTCFPLTEEKIASLKK